MIVPPKTITSQFSDVYLEAGWQALRVSETLDTWQKINLEEKNAP